MQTFSLEPGEDLDGALRRATAYLSQAGIASAAADAQLLAAYLLEEQGAAPCSRGRVQALALAGAPVPEGFSELVQTRSQRVPLQHITGQGPFWTLTLKVGPGVFIPRPETELLVERALAAYRQLDQAGLLPQEPLIADFCTGSGAIAAALATELPEARISAIELSDQALAYAEQNLAAYRQVSLLQGDAREALAGFEGRLSLITSNPPYIPAAQIPADPEVADYDPPLALYGGGELGMDLPRALAARAWELLQPGGFLIMEHDESQGQLMRTLFEELGFTGLELLEDLAGKARHTCAYKPLLPAG